MDTVIDVALKDPAQLFQTADPFPFRENGLEPEAERYFLRKARAIGGSDRLVILLHIGSTWPDAALDHDPGQALAKKLSAAFAVAAEDERRAMSELFATGRRFLMIGLCVLAACLLLASQSEALLGDRGVANLVKESVVVFGWVALWRPAEIFLYDWLPIGSRMAGLRRPCEAEIQLVWTPPPA